MLFANAVEAAVKQSFRDIPLSFDCATAKGNQTLRSPYGDFAGR